MKKENPKKLDAKKLALAATAITSSLSFLATITAIMSPSLRTFTPFLLILYGPLGYNISILGSFLVTIYIAIDTFLLTYAFAWLYNRLL